MRIACTLVLLLLCAGVAQAQSPTPAADNTVPLFGELPFNDRQLEANREFIEEATRGAGTREKAAETACQKGREYLLKADLATAIKRYNQAWLLNPQASCAYQGLGVAAVRQGKFSQGVTLLERARALASPSCELLVDLAVAHLWRGHYTTSPAERGEEYAVSRKLLAEAEHLGPQFGPVFFVRAMLLFFQEDYTAAWGNVEQAEAIDSRTVHPAFLRDLEAKMPRPKR